MSFKEIRNRIVFFTRKGQIIMVVVKKNGGNLTINNKGSIPLNERDMYIFSPADNNVYVVQKSEDGAKVTAYNKKTAPVGSYVYKNTEIVRLFNRAGFANIVYINTEKNGNKTWYQARLLPSGYCTEIYALHRHNSKGEYIPFVDGDESSDTTIEAAVSETSEEDR